MTKIPATSKITGLSDRGRAEAVKPKARGTVSIIITAFNCEAFIGACIDSVLNQTHKPHEVVIVDDGSTDATLIVAQAASRGCATVIARGENDGSMVNARNIGLAATTGALVLFVDGDDLLPMFYVEQMMDEIGDADFIVPKLQFFGDGDKPGRDMLLREWPEPSRAQLWQRNQCPATSLMRRSALLAAGGWRENPARTRTDWSLALRMSARGQWLNSSAALLYRRHGSNWSARSHGDEQEIWRKVRTDAATITVAIPYGGRLLRLFESVLSSVEIALEHCGKTAELLIMDASPEGVPYYQLTPSLWSAIQVVRLPAADASTRRGDKVACANFMAGVCNDILRRAAGDIVWIVEDDIIVPPYAAQDMLACMFGHRKINASVGGFYKTRHGEQDRYVAARVGSTGKVKYITELPEEKEVPVQLTGTGCLMLLRDCIPTNFGVEWINGSGSAYAHDWTFHHELSRLGQPTILLPSVQCRHHTTTDEYLI